MKKTLKIISVMLIIMILNSAVLVNAVQAVEGGQITVYTKGEFKRIITYNGIAVKTTHAVYQENGQEYPVYCLNRDLQGVGEEIATYDVTNQGKIKDLGLWRVIVNGYPYKSIEQLGVADEGEAYIATKQSIYCYIYNRGTENYSGVGEAGNRVINAMNTILENAKNSTESFENQNIEILQSDVWDLDSEQEHIVKQYEIRSDTNISKFIVNLENQPEGCKITDLEGHEKREFSSNEKFKILIPISSLENDGEFKIKIQTQMETKPVYLGKAPSDDLQDYALTTFSYEDIETELSQNYEKNKTKIIIEKQDSETKEVLKGAKFEILNKDKKIIRVAETNKDGQIILEQITPGTYYIREIKAPDGYEADGKLQKIEIKMDEIQNLKIENSKIIIEELPEEEIPIDEEIPIEEEPLIEELPVIEIPKLPVTGM